MRHIKISAAMLCFIAVPMPTLMALSEFSMLSQVSWLLVIDIVCLMGLGVVLIRKRNTTMSRRASFFNAVAFSFLMAFAALFVFPAYMAGMLGRQSSGCWNNLHRIDSAKQEWALENGKANGAIVTETELKLYLLSDTNQPFPKCPQGGTYTIGRMGENPTCSTGDGDWPNTHAMDYTDRGWWTNVKCAYREAFKGHFTRTQY